MAIVLKTEKNSPSHRGGIKKNDNILSINGFPMTDILDYSIYEDCDNVEITLERKGEELKFVLTSEYEYEQLGITFDESIQISPITCHNNCIFCFVDQLPIGMRETLYVKDDDYRLSFISGCYVTCTNLKDEDIDRILRLKLSPLYISVHATTEDVRLRMLSIKKERNQMDILRKLTSGGIKIHAQIVLVGGLNDGEILKKSLTDLKNLSENVLSVAVVPVGLTKYRCGLHELFPLTEVEAMNTIKIIEDFYNLYEGFCFASDEMYQIAKKEVPAFEYYGDFGQIDNGVGLIAKFLDEVSLALENLPKKHSANIGIITGKSGENVMKKVVEMIQNRAKKVKINIYAIENNFFGQTVTVTGLITAGDIIDQVKGRLNGEEFLIVPSVMLKEFEDVFLDGISVTELSEELNEKIVVSAVDGECFVDTVIYGE